MASPVARVPRRRSWLEPLFWLGVPALVAVAPWATRQWAAHRPAREAAGRVAVRLTGDVRRDRVALLEQAWAAARPRPLPANLLPGAFERIVRREAAWLTDIALQLGPLDPEKAARVLEEALQRVGELPERMGPEDLLQPDDTRTGRLLRLARAFHAQPQGARARRAALESARAAEWPPARVYALCLVARETADAEPAFARAALRQARVHAERLPAVERTGALAALAGTAGAVDSPTAARPWVERVLMSLQTHAHGPVALAVAAALIAPAAPDAADRLAGQAVERASRAKTLQDLSFSSPFGSAPVEEQEGFPSYFAGGYPGFLTRPIRSRPADTRIADSHLRRVAVALAVTHPDAAVQAARRIQGAADRSGSLAEVAALLEGRDPSRAAALCHMALAAADKIRRPSAARRAARLRAAIGLAVSDPSTARAVVEPIPPRLILLQLNEFAARLARGDPEAALRLIERSESAIGIGQNPNAAPFLTARAAVAAQLARHDPDRAAALLGSPPRRRAVDGWLTLARGLAD